MAWNIAAILLAKYLQVEKVFRCGGGSVQPFMLPLEACGVVSPGKGDTLVDVKTIHHESVLEHTSHQF